MPKLKLGSTPDQIEQEEALKLRKIEEEVQEENLRRDKKIKQLITKKKRSKAILLLLFTIFIGTMLFFGIYGIFFKNGLSQEETIQVAQAVDQNHFYSDGVESYLTTIFPKLFQEHVSDTSDLEALTPNTDSLYIDHLVELSPYVAKVYFSCDIDAKQNAVNMNETYDEDEEYIAESEESQQLEGEEYNNRYSFSITLEYMPEIDEEGNEIGAPGYRPITDLQLYSLEDPNSDQIVKEFNDKNSFFSFNDLERVDDGEKEKATIELDKILSNIYANKDVSNDITISRKVKSYDAEYLGIEDFEMTKEPNTAGYNSRVIYNIKTKDGFSYQTSLYLMLEKTDTGYKITKMY